jgi:hypothetical protein
VLAAAVALLGGLLVADRVQARGSGPDRGNRVIPYKGTLAKDGLPLTGAAVPMTFVLRGVLPGNVTQEWTYGPVNVDVFQGEFSVRIGEASAVPDWVYSAEQTYVRVSINGTLLAGEQRIYPVPLATWAGESRDLLVEGSLTVNGNTQVNGSVNATGSVGISSADGQLAPSRDYAFRDTGDSWLRLRSGLNSSTYSDLAVGQLWSGRHQFEYANWDGDRVGNGGAAIVNDSGTYKSLMVVGNNSAGGVRKVNVYDDLSVNGAVCNGGYCGRPFITCGWNGERVVNGDGGCDDDIFINCSGGVVTGIRFRC